jgi:two-component system, OmpR family, sensor histidine kinase BaeS
VNRLRTRLLVGMLIVVAVSLLAVPVAVTIAERAALATLPMGLRARVETVAPAPFIARWRPVERRVPLRPAAAVTDDVAGLRAEAERLFDFVIDSRAARRDAIGVAVGLALLVGVVLAQWLSRGIAGPIAAVSAAASELAAGRFGVRVRLPRPDGLPDETRALSENFNAMSAAIERYEGERKAMLADVAHELRTPLAAMRLRLEALADGLVPFERAEVEGLQTHVDLMGRLIDDLRLLSLADAGRLTLAMAEVDLGAWLRRVTDAARPGLERRGVRLAVEAPPSGATLRADPQRLAQVLHNLLDNAARYAPEGSVVDVVAEVDGDLLQVRVRDRGPGVPEDDLATIFERFVQGQRRDQRGAGGTGLGLAIVRTLVGLHGGRVAARNLSTDEGGGAEFTVTLPLRGTEAPARAS